MGSTSSSVRHASLLVLLACGLAACDGCGDASDGTGGGLTSGEGGTGPTSGTLSGGGGDSGTGSSQPTVTVAGSTGSTCSDAVTCEDVEASCGQIEDGCGNILECGDCPTGESCSGGNGEPQVCTITTCIPQTCEEAGANCGPASDGCGDLIPDCGSCAQPETCGGGDLPSVCAVPEYCTGLCLQQVDCPDPGVTTTITGIVYAPGHASDPAPPLPGSADPLFDALVYVPNGPVLPFQPNVQCSQCGEEASGDPLPGVFARTNARGEFTLENVPVGDGVSIVIQLGRWRRVVPLGPITACVDNPVTQEQTRLPRNKNEGDIPLIAIATGRVDTLECVLRKIGIDDSEFTNPNGNGRVRLYSGLHSGGQRIDGSTPNEGVLLDTPAEINQYDMVLFPCQGGSNSGRATPTRKQNLIDYTSAGGRVFSTHYSYDWLHDNGAFASVGDWDVGNDDANDQNGVIDQSFPKGEIFAQWLFNVGASTTLGLMPVVVVRQNIDSVTPDIAQRWMSGVSDGGAEVPLHLTFNTPVGDPPEDQCGRALYSDFHVADADPQLGQTFPNICDNGPMTPQEKLVEFMLFDLGSCLTPDIPVCVPRTCDDFDPPLECGPAADGCNGIIDCGDCEDDEFCGGGGPGQCGNDTCTPKTCAQLGKNCGNVSNQCGEIIACGDCEAPETCGGDGVANVCGDDGPQ